jgi:DNA phosphorothioation-dependent restriction protein DptH
MSSRLHPVLLGEIVDQFRIAHPDLRDGACIRIDDVLPDDAELLTEGLRKVLPGFDIFALDPLPSSVLQINTDKAVELRNRKWRPFVLVVPHGIGDSASSLDNSFDRCSLDELSRAATQVLSDRLLESDLSDIVRAVSRAVTRSAGSQQVPHPEGWPDWISVLSSEPTAEVAGRELWRLGLVPDLASESLLVRLASNVKASRCIAFPSRPAATVIDRLIAALVREDLVRTKLDLALNAQKSPLRFAPLWCKDLLDRFSGVLTFEKWPFSDVVDSELESVTALSFRKHDGGIESWSKLRDEDGQLTCRTAEAKPASIGIKWDTEPRRVSTVARWRIELLPPVEFRDNLSAPVITTFAKGDKRSLSVKIEVSDDDLARGHRFLFVITALDEDGNEMMLESGDPASAETDEFDIVLDDEAVTISPRRSTAGSVAEALLRATLDGLDVDPEAEEYELERATGILRVRLSSKRQAQIQLSPLVIELQQRVVSEPAFAVAFQARSHMGREVPLESISSNPLTLPSALAERRKAVHSMIGRDSRRSIAESVKWDSELQRAVEDYLASYRRALDAANDDQLSDLLLLETLTLRLRTPAGESSAVVLLPLHPLRLAWVMVHDRLLRDWSSKLGGIPKKERTQFVDVELVERIAANNLPFTVLGADGSPMVHAEEVSHGTGLYLPLNDRAPELTIDLAFRSLGVQRDSAALKSRAVQTQSRLSSYRRSHPSVDSLRLIGLNPGQGELLARVVRPLVQIVAETNTSDDDNLGDREPVQVAVTAYADHAPFNDPLRSLHEVQLELKVSGGSGHTSHLNPPLGLAVRPIERVGLDEDAAHVAVVQDISTSEVATSPEESDRPPALQDLLTPTHTRRVGGGSSTAWMTRPSLKSRPDAAPDLAAAHRAHQHAVSRSMGHANEFPVVSVSLAADEIAALRSLHSRADWVITVDRFVGLDLYEDAQAAGLGSAYILDYAPDFVEGLTERLTVTTAHRTEVLRVLERAMTDLGLAHLGSESLVLDTLGMVSGRLALRLVGDDARAREAVSLAALMTYLRSRGELEGQIVIPVDAHPEIFGVKQRAEDEGSRRCDLLLVRITQRSFKIECVEVKARQGAALPAALADRIVDQLQDTVGVLRNRFFADEPARIDRELQRTRLAALLHYYADRSFLNELVDEAGLAELHRQIDRIEAQQRDAEVSLHGYVIALDGRQGFPNQHRGVPIDVLTADELGGVGFTTLGELQERSRVFVPSAEGPVPPGLPAEAPPPSEPGPPPTDSEVSLPQVTNEASPHTVHQQEAPAVQAPVPPHTLSSEPLAQVHNEAGETPASNGGTDRTSVFVGVPELQKAPDPTTTPRQVSISRAPAVAIVPLGKDAVGQEVLWNVSTKGSPHAFIVGIPGQGKSVTTRRIIGSFAEQGLPSVVFDFHGDMAAEPPAGATVIDVARDGLPFSPFELRSGEGVNVNVSALEIAEIVGYVCDLGEIQTNHVYKGVKAAYESLGWAAGVDGSRLPTIEEFADAVEAAEAGAKGRNARNRLSPLTDFGLFRSDVDGLFDPTGNGGGLVVDVSGVALERVQLAATAFMLRKIYREMFHWDLSGVMRLAVVLDEAHRLAKDRTLPKLMKEGRKYGISVVVASQGLSDFKREVVLNAGAKIIFRTNFPDSKTVAGFLRGRDGVDLSQTIENLGVGQAFVSTPDDAKARKVFMYE